LIRVYRAPWSTNCERVALALAHKGITEVDSVLIDYSDRSPVEEVSGQPLVPVIVDDGEVVADSVAIMRHLDERHGEPLLFPPGEPARAHCDVFVEWFNEVYKDAPNAIEAELEGGSRDLVLIEELERRIDAHMELFERLLTGKGYLLEEFSAADVVAYPHLKYAAGRPEGDDELFHVILDERQSVEGRPNLAAWIERVGSRPMAYPLTAD
jgi:glutathione S-transferase